jgi:cysteine desulfurase family protein (TIGR01976 family)
MPEPATGGYSARCAAGSAGSSPPSAGGTIVGREPTAAGRSVAGHGQDGGVTYDVARVRSWFPALREGVAHFDGPGGSQVPGQVADAVAGTLRSGIANRGTVTAAERRAERIVVDARQAVADLLGADPRGVVFGRSMTQLTHDLARTLAVGWRAGDEVVVTRLDHDANIRPWVSAAEAAGATVRWADPDGTTADLPTDAVADLLTDRTRLVAVTGASNLLGTRPDVRAVADAVHAAGALLHVDGVHLTPHVPVDVAALGADFYACSPYKFFGPHLGAVVAAPSLLEQLRPDKLLPSSDAVPERFELGTLPYELLAGTTAAVDVIADLDPDAPGDRRSRVLASMGAVEAHEDGLVEVLLGGLRELAPVTLHGSPACRTPTVLFSVAGRTPREVYEHLAGRGVNAPAGSFYALEASRWLGLGDAGGVRAGLAPYTDEDDVGRLLDGVGELCR